MYRKSDIELFKELLTKDNIRIIAHRSPDGDTLGSCFALCEILRNMGKNAEVVCSDKVLEKLTVLTDGKKELLPTFTPDCQITVDVATEELLGREYEADAKNTDYAIDHHYTNTKYAKKTLLNGECSSAGEFLYYLLKDSETKITKKAARLLYAAIASDTGCFKFQNTCSSTHIAAAHLLEYGIETENLNKALFDEASADYIRFECDVVNEMKLEDGIVLLPVSKAMMEKHGINERETDGLAYMLRRIQGVKVGATLRESDEKIRISIRSFSDVNVAEIAAQLGGGGHVKAAGCAIKGTLEEAQTILFDILKKSLKEAHK